MKYKKFSFYPNVRAAETLIWDRFIDKFPDAYDSVDYNVKVGEGADIPEGTQPNIAGGFKQLTQHKIDVVGHKDGKVEIIELKPYAGATAVGQVIGYRDLYVHHIDPTAKPSLAIITDTERPDTKLICQKQGIKLIIV